MVILIIVAVVAMALGFCCTVALTAALLALFQPKARAGVVICFVATAVAVLWALVAICSSSAFFRYSAGGPVIWFLVWPTLGCVLIGLIAAAFAVLPIRRRLISDAPRVATPTI